MKSQREDCLPQMLRVAVVNGKIHMNVTNTGQENYIFIEVRMLE